MRDLVFYETLEEYRDSVWERFEHLNPGLSFYAKLIDYVIDTRAPIFYKISHPSEHFAFSGAYHFETERDRYPNVYRRSLFWLHDFTHMLFPYAHDVYDVSEKEFLDQFIYQERIASNETEIFAYYRVPGLREHVFQDEKLYYDVIKERGWCGDQSTAMNAWDKPNTAKLLNHRNRLVMDDDCGEHELLDTKWDGHAYPEILKFFQQWRHLTPKWCGERYKSMVGVRVPEPERPLERFSVDTYEAAIENYQWAGTQEGYEQTTMDNIRRAYAMLGWDNPPTKWRHMPEAFDSLEGAVFFQ